MQVALRNPPITVLEGRLFDRLNRVAKDATLDTLSEDLTVCIAGFFAKDFFAGTVTKFSLGSRGEDVDHDGNPVYEFEALVEYDDGTHASIPFFVFG